MTTSACGSGIFGKFPSFNKSNQADNNAERKDTCNESEIPNLPAENIQSLRKGFHPIVFSHKIHGINPENAPLTCHYRSTA